MAFVKGQSGNPGGRKSIPLEQKQEFVRLSKGAPKVLSKIMNDPKQPGAVRVAAANSLLDRAIGRVPQGITGPDGTGPIKVVVEYVESITSERDNADTAETA